MAFPFILAGVGAAAMGGLGAASANKSNQSVKSAARASQEAINANLVQQRLAAMDQRHTLGQQTSSTVGSFFNRGYGRGQAFRLALAQIYSDVAMDSQNITQGMEYAERAAAIDRQNVRNGANAQMQSVGLAAVSGAVQGAQMGYSLGSGIQNLQRSVEINKVLSNPATTPAQTQAVLSGVPVSQLNNPAVTSYFESQQELHRLALQAAKASRNEALANFGYSIFNLRRPR